MTIGADQNDCGSNGFCECSEPDLVGGFCQRCGDIRDQTTEELDADESVAGALVRMEESAKLLDHHHVWLHRLPLWALFVLWLIGGSLLMLGAGCQINEYHATGRNSEIVLDNGSGTQERGGQTTEAINPDVDTGDVGGLPGLR